jgi:hypothetical protein
MFAFCAESTTKRFLSFPKSRGPMLPKYEDRKIDRRSKTHKCQVTTLQIMHVPESFLLVSVLFVPPSIPYFSVNS